MRLTANLLFILIISILRPFADFSQVMQVGGTIYADGYEDFNGETVDISDDGNVIVMGAVGNDSTFENGGHVRVFEWDGTAWLQRGDDFNATLAFQGVGQVVSLSGNGNVLAITTMPEVNLNDIGEVSIYEWNGGIWVQRGLTLYGESSSDQFGYDIALNEDGSVLSVGAIYNSATNTESGHVRVFSWNGVDWLQKGADIDGFGAYEYFGISVSIDGSGDTLVAGGLGNMAIGFARVFSFDGINWSQIGGDISGENIYENCGREVKISSDGSTVAVGSTGDYARVRLFTFDGTSWILKGTEIGPGEAGDLTGTAFDLSDDGNRVVVGAGNYNNMGEVRFYNWNGVDWSLNAPNISGEDNGEAFGYSLALSADGQRVVVGAPWKTEFQVYTGVVRVFEHILSVSTETPSANFVIYPNPARESISITGSDLRADLKYKVMNYLGKDQNVLGTFENNVFHFQVGELVPGIYLIEIDEEIIRFVLK